MLYQPELETWQFRSFWGYWFQNVDAQIAEYIGSQISSDVDLINAVGAVNTLTKNTLPGLGRQAERGMASGTIIHALVNSYMRTHPQSRVRWTPGSTARVEIY